MALQLHPKVCRFVLKCLERVLPNAQYWVFGSRAKGTAHLHSDLDIALITNEPILLETLSSLEETFAESNIPFKIDIVDWHRISPEFRTHIKQYYVPLKQGIPPSEPDSK